MQFGLLALDEDRVLKEQIRFLLSNVSTALLPTLALSSLLVWALSPSNSMLVLMGWWSVMTVNKLLAYLYARRHLASDLSLIPLRRMAWIMLVANALDGAIWGSLTWLTIRTSTEAGVILLLAVTAGMLGAGLSRLSAIPLVFLAFCAPLVVLLLGAIWQLESDPAFQALGAVCLIYAASLTLISVNTARGIRAAINLRFENADLLRQLRNKTELAQAAQREAEQANAAKSKFLAAASHDLRQPVHAQGLFLDVLSRTSLSPTQQELLKNAQSAAAASSEMLNALLDFSRIEAGVIEPRPQAVKLQTLLHKLETELAPQADAKGMVYRSRETALAAYSDPILLDLILRNLISNAIRYTLRGGVLVACRRRDRHAVIEVWDTGIGIAPEHQQDVFLEFHQLGNPERDRRKGLGLGLAIARGLAQAMGHEILLSSVPGRGSVFRLTVPLTDAAVAPAVFAQATAPVPRLHARVLVIDDDEAVRAAMLPLLRDWGCECETAESIEAAVSAARAIRPDLILSDYRLRMRSTGVEAIAAVRAVCGANLPALLITGDTAPERLREAQATGLPLLHKPVAPDRLYREMIRLLTPPSPRSRDHR